MKSPAKCSAQPAESDIDFSFNERVRDAGETLEGQGISQNPSWTGLDVDETLSSMRSCTVSITVYW
jgi:hypothetical protein